jgi:NitT/TauT family transport system ATP-binding protein
MHGLIGGLWREHGLTILMVTHDIREAFKLATRVLALDKRRHDPQAPDRFGATVVYDVPLDRAARRRVPPEWAQMLDGPDDPAPG